MPIQWRVADSLLVALVAAVSIWFTWVALPSLARVDEDAAMLLRYAQNMSQSGVVAYNLGDGPTDGATDIVFVVVLAVLTGLTPTRDVFSAYALLAIITTALTGAGVYFSARVQQRGTRLASFVGATFIGVGAQRVYIAAGYGTAFFALLVLAAFIACTHAWSTQSVRERTLALFAIAAAVVARPDGIVVIAALIVFIFWSQDDPHRLRKAATYALAAFITLCSMGALRLLYFGHAMPLAWLRKGGEFSLARLSSVGLHFMELAFPLLVILALAMASPRRRPTVQAACLLLLTAGLPWALVSDAQNLFGRFQYPVLPVLACCLCGFSREDDPEVEAVPIHRNPSLLVPYVLLGFLCVYYWNRFLGAERRVAMVRYQGTGNVAAVLRKLNRRDLRLATTEGGILPFVSGLRSLDCWGLNDRRIAEQGYLTRERLIDFRPDIIMINVNAAGNNMPDPALDEQWLQMARVMQNFATEMDYALVAAFGGDESSGSIDLYYASRSLRDDGVLHELRRTPYGYYGQEWSDITDSPDEIAQRLAPVFKSRN